MLDSFLSLPASKLTSSHTQDEFREKVRRQHVEENNKYSGKHGLPRLTTFGSVFSLFPRSTGEGYEAP